mmetsp:Transcript_1866/g.2552  ORF Transcript_1866/g.2552 Transcript_1866/m.2552 type:complete len:103 (-) Transcript_1866:2318-2626(-)
MISGGQDTYIVVYDLVADAAQYKLMGHKEEVTQLATFIISNPFLKGAKQTVLVTSSKDGYIKFWDVNQQACLTSFSDDLLTKVNDFALVPELTTIVVGLGSD